MCAYKLVHVRIKKDKGNLITSLLLNMISFSLIYKRNLLYVEETENHDEL